MSDWTEVYLESMDEMRRQESAIHESAVIYPGAKIGKGNRIMPGAVIFAGVELGDSNYIGAHAVLGGPPESREHWHGHGVGVKIGSGCFIGNGVTVDSGCTQKTIIEDNVTMLRNSHAGHDSLIEQHATVSCSVLIGGYATVMAYANCGFGSCVHQGCVVGPLAFLGAGSVVTKQTKIEPMKIFAGVPARLLKENTVGVERANLTVEAMQELVARYHERFR